MCYRSTQTNYILPSIWKGTILNLWLSTSHCTDVKHLWWALLEKKRYRPIKTCAVIQCKSVNQTNYWMIHGHQRGKKKHIYRKYAMTDNRKCIINTKLRRSLMKKQVFIMWFQCLFSFREAADVWHLPQHLYKCDLVLPEQQIKRT